MRRRSFLATPLVALAVPSRADTGYAGVVPGTALAFPRDHGSHPEFRTEWWYVTAWVADEAGNPNGVQVTFFRNRPRVAEDNPSAFAPRQLVFAHAALGDRRRGRLVHDQRAAREGFGLAGTTEGAMRAWIDDWSLEQAGTAYTTRVVAREFTLDLRFTPTQPILLQGDAGYSRKGPLPGEASWYYSLPHLAVAGTIGVGGNLARVTGTAWLDHEWSSEALAAGAVGWDWVGANLADGGALMAFRMRDGSGNALWAGGTVRGADGRTRVLAPDDVRFSPRRIWTSPRTGTAYPVEMSVTAAGVEFTLLPLVDDQELDSRASTGTVYWEGAVRAQVSGRDVGRGYLELTGYGAPLRL